MTREVQRQIAGFLVEKLDVIADANLYEALEAWSAMRDQRDRARATAVELEQENARLREALLEAADDIDSWGAYAEQYFVEKWGLADDVARVRAAARGEFS